MHLFVISMRSTESTETIKCLSDSANAIISLLEVHLSLNV